MERIGLEIWGFLRSRRPEKFLWWKVVNQLDQDYVPAKIAIKEAGQETEQSSVHDKTK